MKLKDRAAPAPRNIRVLDLFAGAGGLSRGFTDADQRYETVKAVELDIAAAATYAANHPGRDRVFAGRIEDWLSQEEVPSVDVIIGGPPCQGFSTLGKQDVEDDRNFLWRHYAATIIRAKPKYFVVENVATFTSSPQFAEFKEMTQPGGLLEQYAFDARILNAADYGAAQSRKRAVLLGWHRDLDAPNFPKPTHSKDAYVTVADVLSDLSTSVFETEAPVRSTEFQGFRVKGLYKTSELHLTRRYRDISVERFKHIGPGRNRFDIPHDLLPNCWKRHRSGAADVMGRLSWNKPSVTIRTEFFKPEKGRYLHPTENRAITHHEAARLQGFPDDYMWAGSKTSIARQIGNAVPIPLGAAIGRELAPRIQ